MTSTMKIQNDDINDGDGLYEGDGKDCVDDGFGDLIYMIMLLIIPSLLLLLLLMRIIMRILLIIIMFLRS